MTISEGQTALIRFDIENGTPLRKKGALQDLTRLYRQDRQLNSEARNAFERIICGSLLREKDRKVVRWGLNALARLGTREGSTPYVSSTIHKFEGDPEIVGAAIAALSRLYDGKLDMVQGFPSIDPAIRVLASMQTTSPHKIDMTGLSIDIDSSDAEVLKLALLTVGLNRDIQNLLHPRHSNGEIVRQLCQHDDSIVRQYSVWSVMENRLLTLDDLGIPFDTIERQPANVQAKLYQLAAERLPDLKFRTKIIHEGTYSEHTEARNGLAKGIAGIFYDGLADITLGWYDQEDDGEVKALIAEHFAKFSDECGPYSDKVIAIVEADSNLLDRLTVKAEGNALWGKLRARDVRTGMKDLFGTTSDLETMFRQAVDISEKAKTMKVLFLAANPLNEGGLKTDREANDLKAQLATVRDAKTRVEVEHAWAVRVDQIQMEILNTQPDLIHFSGHGNVNLLVFEDAEGSAVAVSGDAIARLIGLVGSVRCVVLNCCFSDSISKHILPHVEAVVGCDDSIADEAAIMFTRAFYRALSHGVTFQQAFNLARNELDLHGKESESEKYKLLYAPPPSA
ncbi:CHAT domain-containing protein [Methylorubrum sp. Q1]|uniref:CHAT domain-containing protein n=1 Tax=Methylorubrum sp. Q1 TaxID=2562453 RepID=UPI0010767DCE|nr:CHAT domain-containing protein [Methylorubrum sp. Q1]TFZ54793.1 CHAT domain-containing protein [Methylorubrum sp. Q1]